MKKADSLRAALKIAGYNARRVSVRHEHFSMGSHIYVTVRDAGVSLARVKEIAGSFEKIDRCEFSGEILSGGNTYLSVEYDRKVTGPVKDAIRAALTAAEPGATVELAPGVTAAREIPGSHGHTAVLWVGEGNSEKTISCWDVDSLTNCAADHVLEARIAEALSKSNEGRKVYAWAAPLEVEPVAAPAPDAHTAFLASIGEVA